MDTLAQTLWQELWAEFGKSVASHHGAFRTPVLATLDGNIPTARTLVLRGANESERTLVFHTHRRSPKCQQLALSPNASVVAYTPTHRLQVRMMGIASVDTQSALLEEHWAKVALSAVRTYATVQPPSSVAPDPTANFPPELECRAPRREEAENARANFALLLFAATSIEVLSLRATGHRRVRWRQVQDWNAEWIAP